ncbi:NADH-quinone oxidoreductase subunit J [Aeromicrobium endophyticum]|uniref:NADH-quinone oxidoreductase subunit J n=1 Tax=Aeromicrobium endophyticum TaxID=2292704 RepID=A0A371P987_9ACTN|nr:NADH-quinone oxidoreductase subunit J [Aeromicrobium endophyticum]REK72479.1 NADH-quinone oxidoreductase subunit J [Aeromicrobium endophyticum]
MNATEVVFVVLSVLAAGSALLAMTSRQLVHAALWLVVTLGAVAGCFVLMTAEFIAWVQVLVYVGAVVVLVIFALMLTRQGREQGSGTTAEVTGNRWIAAVLGVVAAVGLGATTIAGFGGERIEGRRIGTAASIGDALFTDWVLPFEILSGVLLAALVGAIVLSRSGSDR